MPHAAHILHPFSLPTALHRLCTATVAVALLMLANVATAQTAGTDTTGSMFRHLDTVVVSATRTPRSALRLPVPVSVIDRQAIQSNPTTSLPELLQHALPGVELNYAMNQQPSLRLQGFGGSGVLFLVDGERIAGESIENIDYTRLQLNDAERIEVVRGAASALYGSNAVGGVVNLLPRRPRSPWGIDLDLRADSRGQRSAQAFVGFCKGRWSGTTALNTGHAEAQPLPAGGDFDTIYAHLRLGATQRLYYQATDHVRLAARTGYSFRQRYTSAQENDRYRGLTTSLRADYDNHSGTTATVGYHFDQYDKSTFDTQQTLDVLGYRNVQHTVRALLNHTPTASLTLTAGADLMHDYLLSYQFATGVSHRQYAIDAFAQADYSPTENYNIVAALRYDHFTASHMGRLSPKISLVRYLTNTVLRAVYGAGFRAPTLKEMYMDFDMAGIFNICGNPNLRPESSHNFSLSAEHTRGRYTLRAMAYYNRLHNRITTLWDGSRNAMLYTNTQAATVAGADVGVAATWDCGLTLQLSYLYCHEEAIGGGPLSSATRPHSANLAAQYTHAFTGATLCLSASGHLHSALQREEYLSYLDLTRTTLRSYPAYMLWRASAALDISDGPCLTLSVDNLFNYRTPCFSNATPATPGRTIMLGTVWQINPK